MDGIVEYVCVVVFVLGMNAFVLGVLGGQVGKLKKDVEARLDRIERTLRELSQQAANANSESTGARKLFRLLDD
ncbi:hypothetical protein HN371_13270 [Candidatus Poribacteria bacterium]|jgi:F0F1-type ATP synthase membrane subunit b/b'|nr:hypothetical protein [Candidatus Poribacteria bacterium]MBT5533170.1 hypothetical protein [Candidatus Poribacteria bacterium]MBT5712832.1 hypothetical protein [Candidatus Poribacteria bacterium]MBT7096249.1 hypothetical protein [Candidatus Poribacteria bacterium]MBT7807817.1 hypothetical protein [Candidatus Poribacteria bacterium]